MYRMRVYRVIVASRLPIIRDPIARTNHWYAQGGWFSGDRVLKIKTNVAFRPIGKLLSTPNLSSIDVSGFGWGHTACDWVFHEEECLQWCCCASSQKVHCSQQRLLAVPIRGGCLPCITWPQSQGSTGGHSPTSSHIDRRQCNRPPRDLSSRASSRTDLRWEVCVTRQ